MKLARVVSTSVLSLLLGFTVLICTQSRLYAQEQRDEAKPQQEQPRPEAAQPAQDETKPSRAEDAKPAEQSEDKAVKQEDKNGKQDSNKKEDNNVKQDNNSKQMERGAQMGGKNERTAGTRIPDDKFRSHFGRQHTFAVHVNRVAGQPRFTYGGYTFQIVDAWPADWAYTDDCYVDYIDGEYFLFDLAHPGVRIAIMVL
jgi:hypothetical protein